MDYDALLQYSFNHVKVMKTGTSQKQNKSTLRDELRARRRHLNDPDRLALDVSINHYLAGFIAKHDFTTIAAFWPFDGEPNLLPVLEAANQNETQILLPVIRHNSSGPSLIFRPWSPGTEMEKNRYGIPEPGGNAEILLSDIDLLLMPLVGWDEAGNRLGMGAGYYDRALQPFGNSQKPIRVGVAYQLQKAQGIPIEPWDISLHMLLSETGWINLQISPSQNKEFHE